MPISGYFDASLARLLMDWISSARWTEALYDLVTEFLGGVKGDTVVQGKFSADGELAESMKRSLAEGLASLSERWAENPAMKTLEERFGLSGVDLKLLRFFSLYHSFPPLEAYVDKLPEWDALSRLARYCGADEGRMVEAMGREGALASAGIGNSDGPGLRLSKRCVAFSLPEPIIRFIAAEGRESLVSFVLETPRDPCLPASAFALGETTVAAAKAVLSSGNGKPFLLFYGKPGTGKTEFARTLSALCGYKPCFLRHDRAYGTRDYSDLLLAARLVDPEREVLVVDEADEMLNVKPSVFGGGDAKGSVKKSMVNEFLDDARARMIFISNETWRIPDSILRRFAFHLGFDDFNLRQRTRVWDEMNEATALFSDKERNALAARYKANPSRIRQVFDVCSSLAGAGGVGRGSTLGIAEEMLSRGDELIYGIARRERREIASYDPEFLNLGTPAAEIAASLERWKAAVEPIRRGVNLLFYGAPGTGKTAFALHLAESLGFQPIVKRYGDLVSAWVGETEKAIRAAFKEAEGTVLVFDEVDSLLASREGAKNSWERTQANEVLTCMEDFKGIFIASTNFGTILDVASLRRFTFKVEFKPTAPDRRRRLVESYFPGLEMDVEAWSELEALESLTPGDVATAADRLRLSPRRDGRRILDALREETSSRGSRPARIGFGA